MPILRFILFALCVYLVLFTVWNFLTLKYKQKDSLVLWIASIGQGKSSTLAKNCLKARKNGSVVYSNCDDINIDGVRIFDTMDLGEYRVQNAQIEIDEISVYYDNRNYKQTSKQFIKWLRYSRHERLNVNMYTQSYDVDKKIRTLCSAIWFGKKYFRVFTVWRKLRKEIAIKDDAINAESQIVDELAFQPWWIPGNIKITFIPKYINYFDSFKSLDGYKGDLKYRSVATQQ